MRRWEDWERSRLRKIKREERRRRELERAFPGGYSADGNQLTVRSEVSSTYDGSDTLSVASSDEDHWGPQIGGYNEHNPAFPPPPTGVLLPRNELLETADVVGAADLEAMLEVGFENGRDRLTPDRNTSRQNLLQNSSNPNLPRYTLAENAPKPRFNAYAPMSRVEGGVTLPPPRTVVSPVSPTVPSNGMSSAVGAVQTHARKRSGGRGGGPSNGYGPLGPLDPGSMI